MKLTAFLFVALTSAQESCTRPDANTFPGGLIRCDEQVPHGEKCIFVCYASQGLMLQGAARVICDNGEFLQKFPTCVNKDDFICDDCCDWSYRDIKNATVTCSDLNNEQSVCNVKCKDGFILEGDDNGTCTTSRGSTGWNKKAPTCVEGK